MCAWAVFAEIIHDKKITCNIAVLCKIIVFLLKSSIYHKYSVYN